MMKILTDFLRTNWLFGVILLISLAYTSCTPKDDTDPENGRSGFKLLIDNRTGCHYLQAGIFGGLSPRYDKNGRHICDGY